MPYHYSKSLLIALMSISVITGCGGSDGGGDSGDGGVIVDDQFSVQEIPDAAFSATTAATEGMLQFGYLAKLNLAANPAAVDESYQNCSNGGTFNYVHADKDDDNSLSAGDELKVNYRECFVPVMDAALDGTVTYSIEQRVNNMELVSGTISMPELTISGDPETDVKGLVDFQYQSSSTQNTLRVSTIGTVNFSVDGSKFMDIRDLHAVRTENFRDATYTMAGNGTVYVPVFGGSFSYEQVTPWSGNFLEYPEQGMVKIFTSPSDTVTVKRNYDISSKFVYLSSIYGELSDPWTEYSEGLLWGFGNKYYEYASEHSDAGFRYLGTVNANELSDFPVNGTVSMLFSRPMKGIIEPSEGNPSQVFRNDTNPYDSTSVSVFHSGALLRFSPSKPLTTGANYKLTDFEVVDKSDAVVRVTDTPITISKRVNLKVDLNKMFYRVGDTPLLDASASYLNRGEHIQFKWVDMLGRGIVFETPEAAQTRFTVPGEIPIGYIAVGLEVSNEYGDIAKTSFSVMQIDTAPSYFAYSIGMKNLNVVTSREMDFKVNSNDSNPEAIKISAESRHVWSLRIAPPLNEQLKVQKYQNTKLLGNEDSSHPSLWFDPATVTGCSFGGGEFEVFEIEKDGNGDLTKLAVDFQQSCGEGKPPLKGMLRYNSTYRINGG